MAVKDFFILIIRLFGLYSLVVNIFGVVPSFLSPILFGGEVSGQGIVYVFVVLAILLSMFLLLVYEADRIVRFLRLDRGFVGDTIAIEKLDAQTIIKVGCIVIGGGIFVNNLPYFLMHLYSAFRMEINNPGDGGILGMLDYYMGDSKRDHTVKLVINALNLAIGWLLITNYHFIASKLVNSSQKNAQ